MKRDLPAYVYRKKGGKLYFIRRRWPTRRIESEPGTPAFAAEYARILNRTAEAPRGSTFADLVIDYKRSHRFKTLAPRTREDYIGVLDKLLPNWGGVDVKTIRRPHVIRIRDFNADRPRRANYAVQVMRVVFEHGKDIGWITDNPAKGVRAVPENSKERLPWPADLVADFRAAAPLGSRERTCFELLLGTGQRIGDVLRMQWGHIDGGSIRVKQGKTGKVLYVPLTPALVAALDAVPRGALYILTERTGARQWSYRGASHAMRKVRDAIGAEAYDLHSLRYTAACELVEAGCSDELVSAVTGQSLDMVAHYTKQVRQRVRAIKAQEKRK